MQRSLVFRAFAFALAILAVPLGFCDVPSTVAIQGKLEKSDQTALTGTRAYRVRFFDASTAGHQVGSDFTGSAILSATGRFSISIAPPAEALLLSALWYDLAVDSAFTPDGAINPADVFPNRIEVKSVPFALRAAKAEEVATTNSVPIQISIDGNQAGQIVRTIQNYFNIAFGAFNGIDPSSQGGTIGGGANNHTFEDFGTIAGGSGNKIDDTDGNSTNSPYAFIGGGTENKAKAYGAVVGGGQQNVASGFAATIVGGYQNETYDQYSAIGGGFSNKAGTNNPDNDVQAGVVGGGSFNIASGTNSTVSGGDSNAAQSSYATVPGGQNNVAFGQFSFAAGHRAHANHDGTFVWADGFNSDFASTGSNQFLIRATGGVGINKPNPASGALDVSGDIVFNGAIKGNVARTGTTAGLRILRGVINGTTVGTSAILEGDGFTCIRNGTGDYSINYSTPFKTGSFPSVTGSAFGAIAFAVIGSSVSTSVNLVFKDAAGAAIDPLFFHFIAIGQ